MGSKQEDGEVSAQVQGHCGLTGISEKWQEKRGVLDTFTACFSFHYQSTQGPKKKEETKGTVLLSGVWAQFPERRARCL